MGGMAQVVQTEVDDLLAADPGSAKPSSTSCMMRSSRGWPPSTPTTTSRCAAWPAGTTCPPPAAPSSRRWSKSGCWSKTHATGRSWSRSRWKACCANGRNWPAGCATRKDLKDADSLERAAADWQASGHNESWLLEGTRLADAETLAAKPGFRDRLDPTRDFLHASRQRETTASRPRNERQEAELQAARKQKQPKHAARCGNAHRSAPGCPAVTVLIAVMAVCRLVQANHGPIRSRRAFPRGNRLRLVSEAQSMLAGARSGGDVRAFQQLLAAHDLRRRADRGRGHCSCDCGCHTAVTTQDHRDRLTNRSAWRSAPTAGASPPAVATAPCAHVGRRHRPSRRRTAHRPQTRCSVWRSAPTGTASPPAATTRRCGCGTPTPASRSAHR